MSDNLLQVKLSSLLENMPMSKTSNGIPRLSLTPAEDKCILFISQGPLLHKKLNKQIWTPSNSVRPCVPKSRLLVYTCDFQQPRPATAIVHTDTTEYSAIWKPLGSK